MTSALCAIMQSGSKSRALSRLYFVLRSQPGMVLFQIRPSGAHLKKTSGPSMVQVSRLNPDVPSQVACFRPGAGAGLGAAAPTAMAGVGGRAGSSRGIEARFVFDGSEGRRVGCGAVFG